MDPQIILTPTTEADLAYVCSLEVDTVNSCYIIPYSLERHRQVLSSKDEAHFLIRDSVDTAPLGFIILAGLASDHLSLEIRRIVIEAKGKGYGRKCLRLLKSYCFQVLGYHRLWLDVFEDNKHALHLYKSEGFVEEGKIRDAVRINGRYKSLLLLSMLESEYSPS